MTDSVVTALFGGCTICLLCKLLPPWQWHCDNCCHPVWSATARIACAPGSACFVLGDCSRYGRPVLCALVWWRAQLLAVQAVVHGNAAAPLVIMLTTGWPSPAGRGVDNNTSQADLGTHAWAVLSTGGVMCNQGATQRDFEATLRLSCGSASYDAKRTVAGRLLGACAVRLHTQAHTTPHSVPTTMYLTGLTN